MKIYNLYIKGKRKILFFNLVHDMYHISHYISFNTIDLYHNTSTCRGGFRIL